MLSTVLFIVAIGFAAAAVWIWYSDDSTSGPGTPPPANTTGEVDLAQVLMVLDASDDAWDYGRSPATAQTDQIDGPGQHLKLGDASLFVFIFTGPNGVEDREAASERIDLDTMQLTTRTGTTLNEPGDPLYMAEHGNVITILVGGDEDLNTQVAEALTNLP